MSSTALHVHQSFLASARRRWRLRIRGLWGSLRIWVRRVRERSELARYMEMHSGIGGDTGIFIADAQQELSKHFWQR
jgi:uncharacterized protein YjiS (DUF1127 family)